MTANARRSTPPNRSTTAAARYTTRMSHPLDAHVAIVTGAARGIGRAVTRAYALAGASVIAVDRIGDELHNVVEALQATGADVHAIAIDLTNPAAAERIVLETLDRHGRIDILANVAGVIREVPLADTSDDIWNLTLDVNLTAPFRLCRAVAPVMIRQRRGSIINVSSRAGTVGVANEVAYCASKFALEGLSRALAQERAPHGIAVNTITPGIPLHTAMSETTYGPEHRAIWRDPAVVTPAFVHLALQTPDGIHDQHVNAWRLSETLRGDTP
jgi:NAD(P)-dependent dehydrogenase (short-subunit alcohol dehydrogenase family)